MDAGSTTGRFARPTTNTKPLSQLIYTSAVAAVSLLSLAAILLLCRRWLGGYDAPLPAPHLLIASVGLGGAAYLIRKGLASPKGVGTAWSHQVLLSVMVMLAALTICVPAQSLPLSCCAIFFVTLTEINAWRQLPVRKQLHREEEGRPTQHLHDGASLNSEVAEETGLPDEVIQQQTRSRDEAGMESIYALVRANFSRRERTRTLHVGFCPPLPRSPQVTLAQLEGPDVRLKLEQVETFGARIEVKLSAGADEPVTALIEMHAQVGVDESVKGGTR